MVDAFRRALGATRDRWQALERDRPDADLVREHRGVHILSGHTIDPETSGLHPAYAAVRRGRSPLFVWWSPTQGFDLPAKQESEWGALDVLGGCDVPSLPCELAELVSGACDLGCDPGCL